MKTTKIVDSTVAPFFGGDTDELISLRKLALCVKQWKDEANDVSQETIFDMLKEVEKVQRKNKKRNN